MTVADYIQGKFQTFGINLSEADLLEMSLSSGVNGEDELTGENIGLVSVSMVGFIPSLLLRATSKSVSENVPNPSLGMFRASRSITLSCARNTDWTMN